MLNFIYFPSSLKYQQSRENTCLGFVRKWTKSFFCKRAIIVQFSRSVVSDSLRPHESQHTRPPCPSPTPGVHSDSRSSSQWCHPAISSSVIPFSSFPQSLPASESFPMSQFFAWGGQSTGVSVLASFLPEKSQGSFRMDWLDLCLGNKYLCASCRSCSLILYEHLVKFL